MVGQCRPLSSLSSFLSLISYAYGCPAASPWDLRKCSRWKIYFKDGSSLRSTMIGSIGSHVSHSARLGVCLSMLRPHRETLNQFRPSVPVWSEPLWQTFIKHVAKSILLILRIFTSYYYNEFGQLKKFINYILSSSELKDRKSVV